MHPQSSTHLTPVFSELTEENLKSNFKLFLFFVWKHKKLPLPTPLQQDIADYLQHGPRRRGVQGFRGVAKTYIAVAYCVWRLWKNPHLKVMIVSASQSHAQKVSTFMRSLILEMAMLRHLQPNSWQRDSMLEFDVGPAGTDKDPSVRSAGITGQITGGRADIILADDVEIPHNSDTVTKREKLKEAIKEFDNIIKPGGEIIYLGTPQSAESIYRDLLNRGYEFRIWPARYPTGDQLKNYQGALAPLLNLQLEDNPSLAGKPTEPSRFGELELKERELSLGRSGFSLQFMLDTSLSDALRYPLRMNDLVVMDLNPRQAPSKVIWTAAPRYRINELPLMGFTGDYLTAPMWVSDDWTDYAGGVMYIDPSGRGKDRTGYAVVKLLHSLLYITAYGSIKGGYETDSLTRIANIAKTQGIGLVLVEPNFGDGMFTQLLRPVMQKVHSQCSVEDADRATRQKELRIIDVLEPVLNQHRLVIDRTAILTDYRDTEEDMAYNLLYQLTHITRDRGALSHDDTLDALAGAVRYWIDRLAKDVDQAEQEYQTLKLEEELADFVSNSMFLSMQGTELPARPSPNWIRRP